MSVTVSNLTRANHDFFRYFKDVEITFLTVFRKMKYVSSGTFDQRLSLIKNGIGKLYLQGLIDLRYIISVNVTVN